MFKPKTTILAATTLAIGVLGATPFAQAGTRHPDRHPDAKRHIIGVLQLQSRSFEPNVAWPPGPSGA